jgi:hypothetical protein
LPIREISSGPSTHDLIPGLRPAQNIVPTEETGSAKNTSRTERHHPSLTVQPSYCGGGARERQEQQPRGAFLQRGSPEQLPEAVDTNDRREIGIAALRRGDGDYRVREVTVEGGGVTGEMERHLSPVLYQRTRRRWTWLDCLDRARNRRMK